MLQTSGGKVFIEGKETTDATLIGYAYLDQAEKSADYSNISQKFESYLKENKLSYTNERKLLLDTLLTMKAFDGVEFTRKATTSKCPISHATCYNFLQLCVDAGIVMVSPKKYSLSSN